MKIMDDEQQRSWMGDKDVTDEMRIQFALDAFYESLKGFEATNDKIRQMKLQRNNILNMTDTYLKKFNNKSINDEFYKQLKKAKKDAAKNGKINKYAQYMNEMRVVQEYKGIRENISDKLALQLIELFRNSEVVIRGETDDN